MAIDTDEHAEAGGDQPRRKTPPVSRTLRLLTGGWLVFVAIANVRAPYGRSILVVCGTFAATFAYYALVHRIFAQREYVLAARIIATVLPIAVFWIVSPGNIWLGVLVFFGVSLVVQALRGDRGCEVMTLPTLAFKRKVNLPCLIFTPLDRIEEGIYRNMRRP